MTGSTFIFVQRMNDFVANCYSPNTDIIDITHVHEKAGEYRRIADTDDNRRRAPLKINKKSRSAIPSGINEVNQISVICLG